jgi:hypothetical protein
MQQTQIAVNLITIADGTSREVQSGDPLRSGGELGAVHSQLVTCRLDQLRPHSSYVRHQLAVLASQLSAVAEMGDFAFPDPLVVTRDGTLLDGYARLEWARQQGRETLPCLQYEMTEAEALQCLLQKHSGSHGLNAFSRILLAMDLEPWFREKARSNQQAGGHTKGSSNLTKAQRLDVRREMAAAAGVSTGNVAKAKQLTMTGRPELLEAVRSGEISIHRAWLWSKDPSGKQLAQLRGCRENRAGNKIKRLIHGISRKATPPRLTLPK